MSTDAIIPDTARDDRDNWGRFQTGNRVGRNNSGGGNSHRVAQLNRAFLDCSTPEMVAELFAMAHERAKTSDKVLTWLLDKLTGRPVQSSDVTIHKSGATTVQTDIQAVVQVIAEETPDPEMRLRIARRILRLSQPAEGSDGSLD